MKPALTATILAIATVTGAAALSPLAGYVDRARVLVIAADAQDNTVFRRQVAALAGAAAALAERQVVIIQVVGASAHDERGRLLDAVAVRTAAELPGSHFGVTLIGKDGGVKLVKRTVVPLDVLLGVIDAMPMRRQEMLGTAPS